jgi:hypothetical protein
MFAGVPGVEGEGVTAHKLVCMCVCMYLCMLYIHTLLFILLFYYFLWPCSPAPAMVSSFTRFLDHIQRRATIGRTPLDEWSTRRRYLYLTTHNTHNRQTSMPPVGFERTIAAGERPSTYSLDRAATWTGIYSIHTYMCIYICMCVYVCVCVCFSALTKPKVT